MGKLWKVKSAKIKGEYLVIVAEKEIPLSKILDNEVLEEEEEPTSEEKEEKEAKRRLGIGGAEEGPEEEEEEEDEPEEKLVKAVEGAEKVHEKIEEAEMKINTPVSKMKGQKGRVLASVDNGNESLAEITEETKIGYGSVSSQLSWLKKNGFVKSIGKGQYGITAKGKNYLRKLEAIE